MKITCTKTTSEDFDLKEVTTVFSNSFVYGGQYGIEIGKEYIVMGIMSRKDSNCIYYLIDTNTRPDWYPYLLFEISDNTMPINWFAKINGKKEEFDYYYLTGFDELCNEDGFYQKLVERDEEVMRIYFRRKIEIEKSLEG